MFDHANPESLVKVVRSVITSDVVSEGKYWELDDRQRQDIHLAMFGPGTPSVGNPHASLPEQKEAQREFTEKVARPVLRALPPHTGAWGVLLLYHEFVDAVYIRPVWEADIGGGD
jgi:hypothetical protein